MSARRRVIAVVVIVVAIAVVGITSLLMDGDRESSPTRTDVERLQRIVGVVAATGRVPMKDGAFDPYEFVRQGEIGHDEVDVFRSASSGIGPTAEEIDRGDYTNFPWERSRRGGDSAAEPFPLLWEKVPDPRGCVLAAFSDGSVMMLDQARVRAALERH